jgi:hypothetical protein
MGRGKPYFEDDPFLKWVSQHQAELETALPGKRIAVGPLFVDGTTGVVASADTYAELYEKVKKLGMLESTLIAKVRDPRSLKMRTVAERLALIPAEEKERLSNLATLIIHQAHNEDVEAAKRVILRILQGTFLAGREGEWFIDPQKNGEDPL